MCFASFPWWVVFFVLVIFGAIGGFARHILDATQSAEYSLNSKGKLRYRSLPSIIVGAVAGLVVPLFLNASSSRLINGIIEGLPEGTSSANENVFFLMGYCILAGLVGNHFLTSMATRTIQAAQEAKKEAGVAIVAANTALDKAKEASVTAHQGAKQAMNLTASRSPIDKGDFEEASKLLHLYVENNPHDAEGYAWLAYVHKNKQVQDIKAAILAIEKAIRIDRATPPPDFIGPYEGPQSWLFNLACYYALDGRSEAEVVNVLRKAFIGARDNKKEEHLKTLLEDLTQDPDLDRIRSEATESSEFSKLLADVKQSIL